MDASETLSLLKAVCGSETPPSPSPEYRLVLQLAADEITATEHLAEAIAASERINRRFLILANSLHKGPQPIRNSLAACTLLERNVVADVLWIIAVTNVMQSHSSAVTRGGNRLWKHSLLTAILCHYLTEDLVSCPESMVMAAGMAHDVGHLLLHGPASERGVDWHREHDLLVEHAPDLPPERNHCLLGCGLLRFWDAPNELVETALYHHNPEHADKRDQATVAIVRFADLITEYVDEESNGCELALQDSSAWTTLRTLGIVSSSASASQLIAEALIPAANEAERITGLLAE